MHYMAISRDFFQGHIYLHLIFTLNADFKLYPLKIIPYCATMYKVYEKLQKEKHDTLSKTEDKYRKDKR